VERAADVAARAYEYGQDGQDGGQDGQAFIGGPMQGIHATIEEVGTGRVLGRVVDGEYRDGDGQGGPDQGGLDHLLPGDRALQGRQDGHQAAKPPGSGGQDGHQAEASAERPDETALQGRQDAGQGCITCGRSSDGQACERFDRCISTDGPPWRLWVPEGQDGQDGQGGPDDQWDRLAAAMATRGRMGGRRCLADRADRVPPHRPPPGGPPSGSA